MPAASGQQRAHGGEMGAHLSPPQLVLRAAPVSLPSSGNHPPPQPREVFGAGGGQAPPLAVSTGASVRAQDAGLQARRRATAACGEAGLLAAAGGTSLPPPPPDCRLGPTRGSISIYPLLMQQKGRWSDCLRRLAKLSDARAGRGSMAEPLQHAMARGWARGDVVASLLAVFYQIALIARTGSRFDKVRRRRLMNPAVGLPSTALDAAVAHQPSSTQALA